MPRISCFSVSRKPPRKNTATLPLPDPLHGVTQAVQEMRFGDQRLGRPRGTCGQQGWWCFDPEDACGKGGIEADCGATITVTEALVATANGTGLVCFDRR